MFIHYNDHCALRCCKHCTDSQLRHQMDAVASHQMDSGHSSRTWDGRSSKPSGSGLMQNKLAHLERTGLRIPVKLLMTFEGNKHRYTIYISHSNDSLSTRVFFYVIISMTMLCAWAPVELL